MGQRLDVNLGQLQIGLSTYPGLLIVGHQGFQFLDLLLGEAKILGVPEHTVEGLVNKVVRVSVMLGMASSMCPFVWFCVDEGRESTHESPRHKRSDDASMNVRHRFLLVAGSNVCSYLPMRLP